MVDLAKRFPRYSKLLALYPANYRHDYREQMLQTVADMLDDQPTGTRRLLTWLHVGLDLPIGIINQNTLAIGDNLMHQTPGYIKRNGLVAASLLIPFVAALVANGLDKLINNHTLYHSWVWSTPSIIIWVMVLPLLAFLLALASYILYEATAETKESWPHRLLDIKHTWPVLLTGLFGLGIILMLLFHDSVHCLAENPAHYVTQFHQTWQCVTSGFLGGR